VPRHRQHAPPAEAAGPAGPGTPEPTRHTPAQGRRAAAVATQTPRAEAGCYAAIDLGTNNCRLLVARPDGDGFRVVDAFSRIVRLGEGVGASRHLSETAMRRAIDALKVCAAKVRRRPGCRLRAVATAACRQARNRGEFLARVHRETGLELEVIDPQEEARLALGGCAPLLAQDVRNGLIFDIGGGSTELCWLTVPSPDGDGTGVAEGPELVAWHSMPVGVAGLAERFQDASDSQASYEAMVEAAASALHTFADDGEVARAFAGRPVQMVGASGTVTTLAGVHKDLPRYDRRRVDGCVLSAETVRATSRRIAAMSPEERLRHPCIGPQRADLVIAGCAILEAICRAWPVERLTVADRGLREGILYRLMNERGEPAAPAPPL
jgi:exopolyphosphatase/guanosine-5'-triphosphate,3'-diphosphate pyrophosphatase